MKPPDKINKQYMKLFWTFVFERHNIWHKRFVLKEDPPWTKNPILESYKFTNVYRKLDRGTIYLMDYLYRDGLKSLYGVLFPIIAYRIMNRVETFERLGYIPQSNFNEQGLQRQLEAFARQGHSVFTNAHSLPPAPKGKTKIESYVMTLVDIRERYSSLYWQVKENLDLVEEAWKVLQSIRRIGPFYAYQICRDLSLASMGSWNEDEWADVGPGCKQGLAMIFGTLPRTSLSIGDSYLNAMKWMWFNQRGILDFYGFNDFPYLDGEQMELGDIQNCLCEFSKYIKILENRKGRYRLRFNSSTSGIDQFNTHSVWTV